MTVKMFIRDMVKPFRVAILLRIVAIIYSDLVSVLFAVVLGDITTSIIQNSMLHKKAVVSFIYLFLSVAVINPLLLYFSNKAILKKSIESDAYIFKKVLNQRPSIIIRNKSGELSSKLIEYGIELRWALIDLCVYPVVLLVTFVILIWFATTTHILYVIVVFVLVVINWRKSELISKCLTTQKIKYMEGEQKIIHVIYSIIEAIDFLTTNKWEDLVLRKFGVQTDCFVEEIAIKKNVLNSICTCVSTCLDSISYAIIILFGINLVQRNQLEIGVVITISYYFSILSKQFINVDKLGQAKKMKIKMQRELFECINKQEIAVPQEISSIEICRIEYSQRNIRLKYDKNMIIEKGDKVAIIGANGTGKTTLLYLLSGIYDCKENEILVNGKNLKKGILRKNISFVDVNATILSDSIREYLVCNRHDYFLQSEIVEQFELYDIWDLRVETLSGGERRRIDLARTILENKSIIMLDEPEVFLDMNWKEKIIEIIKDSEKTVIFTTHDPLFLSVANKIIELEAN